MKKNEIGKEIIELIYDSGLIKIFPKDKKDGWKLHSKKWSPFYIQLRHTFSKSNHKLLMDKIGSAMTDMIKQEIPQTTKLVGIASAGVPFSTIISYKSGIPSCYTRKIDGVENYEDLKKKLEKLKKKLPTKKQGGMDYGEHSYLEGDLSQDDEILLIDDLITDGDSKRIAKEIVEFEAAERQKKRVNCSNVAVVIDREQGGKEELERYGISLHSLIPFKTKGIHWIKNKISEKEYNLICEYLENDTKFQKASYRKKFL